MNADERVRELEKALEQCLAWAARLDKRVAELEGSKTWRAQLALARAAGSWREALRLPGRLFRILRGEPAVSAPPALDPHWPDDVPLLSVAGLDGGQGSLASDCESLSGGFEEARGRYFCRLEPGQSLPATWFERAVVALENDPGAAVCYSAELGPEAAPFEADRLERFCPVPPGAVFRRELWEALGACDMADQQARRDFWLRAARAGYQGRMLGREAVAGEARFRSSGRFPRGADFSAEKPCTLLILPWLAYGGAEQVALQLLEGLRDDFSFAVVAVESDAHLRRDAFEALTPWVYCLDELGVRDPAAFLADFTAAHNIRGALVSSTGVGYRALPALRGLWRGNIAHNVASEGHLAASLGLDAHIEMHFAVGELQRQALLAGGVAAHKVKLVPNGVDALGRFEPARYADRRNELRAELGFGPDDFVFAYVARLSEEKSPLRFVVAMSLLRRMFPDCSIRGVMAGDGPERIAVERLIGDEGLRGCIRTLGFTERIPEVLAAADVFVLPSRVEGSPLTLLEAMSMGLPCVAADVGAVAEVVKDGETGLLVRGGRAGLLADSCARLLQEPELGPRLGAAARRLVVDKFDLRRTIGCYKDALLREIGPTIRN